MTTLLLLLQDIAKLGRSGDIVRVKPGYARNFLLPKGLGMIASKNALRMAEKLKRERELKAAEDKKESEELAKKLAILTLTVAVKVDAEGHMYGSVAAQDIVHLLEKEGAALIDKRAVVLKAPIKALGLHTIELKLKEGVIASFHLNVISEQQAEEKKETASEE